MIRIIIITIYDMIIIMLIFSDVRTTSEWCVRPVYDFGAQKPLARTDSLMQLKELKPLLTRNP